MVGKPYRHEDEMLLPLRGTKANENITESQSKNNTGVDPGARRGIPFPRARAGIPKRSDGRCPADSVCAGLFFYVDFLLASNLIG